MLTKTSLAAAVPLADLLASKGITLIPQPGTPLLELVQASNFALAVESQFEGAAPLTDLPMDGYAAKMGESSATDEHDALMADFVSKAAEAVRFTHKLARSTVNPQIEQVLAAVQKALDENAVSVLNPLNIETREVSALANPDLLNQLAGNYGHVLSDRLSLSLRIPMPENIADYLTTGQDFLDGSIADYVEKIGLEGVAGLWGKLFGGQASNLQDIVSEHKPDTYADGVLAMIIVRNMQESIPAGVPVDLSEYNVYMAKLREQLGRILYNIPSAVKSIFSPDRLVMSAPLGDNPRGSIVVNGPAYQSYLQQGGTPEAIFGALNNGTVPPMADLITQQERYTGHWGRVKERLSGAEVQRRFQAVVTACRQAIAELIAATPDDELRVPRADLHERLNKAIQFLNPGSLEDLYGTVRHLICDVLYPHTGAEQMLVAIDVSAKAGGDVGDAVRDATVDYLVDWLCFQIFQQKA